jgi:hypothetical protein
MHAAARSVGVHGDGGYVAMTCQQCCNPELLFGSNSKSDASKLRLAAVATLREVGVSSILLTKILCVSGCSSLARTNAIVSGEVSDMKGYSNVLAVQTVEGTVNHQ